MADHGVSWTSCGLPADSLRTTISIPPDQLSARDGQSGCLLPAAGRRRLWQRLPRGGLTTSSNGLAAATHTSRQRPPRSMGRHAGVGVGRGALRGSVARAGLTRTGQRPSSGRGPARGCAEHVRGLGDGEQLGLVVGGGVGHGWLPRVVGGGASTTEGAISGAVVKLHSQLCLTISGCSPVAARRWRVTCQRWRRSSADAGVGAGTAGGQPPSSGSLCPAPPRSAVSWDRLPFLPGPMRGCPSRRRL